MSPLGPDMPISVPVLCLAVVVSAIAAAVQGAVGFGYAIVAVPLLSLVDPHLAPVPQILTALPLTLMTAWRERGHIDGRGAAWILVGRAPGFIVGAVLIAMASRRVLDAVVGFAVLAGVACLSTRVRLPRSRLIDLSVGTVSGISGYVSGIGGPPLALLYRDARGPTVRATLGVLFAVGVVATVLTRVAVGQVTSLDVRLSGVLVAPVIVGAWGSRFLHRWVEGRPMRIAVLALSAVAGCCLLLRAMWRFG